MLNSGVEIRVLLSRRCSTDESEGKSAFHFMKWEYDMSPFKADRKIKNFSL